jgi:hypothetical protein
MKIKVLIVLGLFLTLKAASWGLTGHRVIADIAQLYLTKKARKEIVKVLGTESLVDVANYMDFIKSDRQYDYMSTWHYVTIPDGETYATITREPKGDIIWAINKFIGELKSDTLTLDEAQFAVKCLVHLVGDIHQPLHVGNGLDRGGNDIKIKYFWQSSNLHRIWDSGIIDGQNLSYSEWTLKLNHISKKQVAEWQAASVIDWAGESMELRASAYNYGEQKNLTYRYNYDHIEELEERLIKAGIRLAGILNDIYQ